jgi:hypothetical protein
MENSTLINHYAKLTDLSIVARSSHRMIGKAIEHGLINDYLASSYLTLALSFREYSYAIDIPVDRFCLDEFDTVLAYYHRLVCEHPDLQLLIFSLAEVKPILQQVGGLIRSIVLTEESSIGLTT